jgi:hypothetical protein
MLAIVIFLLVWWFWFSSPASSTVSHAHGVLSHQGV